MSLQYLKKEVTDEVDFLHAAKHRSFLQVDFNTLGIKVSHKVILLLLLGIIKHSQSTQSDNLQYLYNISEKEVRNQFFFHADKHHISTKSHVLRVGHTPQHYFSRSHG